MPDWASLVRARIANLGLDPSVEAEIVEELSQHLDDRYRELVVAGKTEEQARNIALSEMGDSDLPGRLCQLRSPVVREVLESNVRPLFSRRMPFSVRILARHWKLSSVAVLSLAGAICAVVLGLSFFNALLLRPLNVRSPAELVTLYASSPDRPIQSMSLEEYKYYRRSNHVFSGVTAYNYGIGVNILTYGNRSQRIVRADVSDTYFQVLGVQPIVGSAFSGDDTTPDYSVVLSYPFWQRIGGDPGIVGKEVEINGQAMTVAGVAPKSFTGTVAGFAIDLWAPIFNHPITNANDNLLDRRNRFLRVIGRLKPGISLTQARSDVALLGEQLAREYPATNKDHKTELVPATLLPDDMVGTARFFAWIVIGVVFLVMVAACANVLNLMLGLATARRQELLIRLALGASRATLARMLLRESAWLSLVAAIAGIIPAYIGLQSLYNYHPVLADGIPPLVLDFRPDMRVFALTVLVILLATLLSGLLPALHTSIPNLASALNGEVAAGGRRKRRARNTLVVIQTAVCTLVLVGTGLCFRSLQYLERVSLGFSARNLLGTYFATGALPNDTANLRTVQEQLRKDVAAIPGVTDVTFTDTMPLGGNWFETDQVQPEEQSGDHGETISHALVEENYFKVLGIPLLQGRTFTSRDTDKAPLVAIVNRTLANHYWPGADAIGKRLRLQSATAPVQVVGVVGDCKYTDLDEPQLPFIYLPLAQRSQSLESAVVIAATAGEPQQWKDQVHQTLDRAHPSMVFLMVTMQDQINASLLLSRIILACVAGFGLLALLLAMAGLYATTSYSVSERKKEIGIRIALGAQPGSLMALILRQTTAIAAIGMLIGLILGIVLSGVVGAQLFGIRTLEPAVLIGVATVTTAIAGLTAYSAARPWVRTDPMEAVRHA